MQEIQARIKEMFPSIYLTLVSMIQAIALEALFSHAQELDVLWSRTAAGVSTWLQVFFTFHVIFYTWLVYSQGVVAMRWVLGFRDAFFPFAIGALEFLVIATTGPDTVPLWFGAAGLAFLTGAWVFGFGIQRARQESENREVTARISVTRVMGPIAALAAICLIAAVLSQIGIAGPRAILLLAVLSNSLMVVATILWVRTWRGILGSAREATASAARE